VVYKSGNPGYIAGKPLLVSQGANPGINVNAAGFLAYSADDQGSCFAENGLLSYSPTMRLNYDVGMILSCVQQIPTYADF